MREQRIGATDHELYCQNQLEKLTTVFCHSANNILTFLRWAPIQNSFTHEENILIFENRRCLIVSDLHLLFFVGNVRSIPEDGHASQPAKT